MLRRLFKAILVVPAKKCRWIPEQLVMGTVRVNYNHLSWRNFNDLFDTGAMLPEIRGHEAIGDALPINARLACQNFVISTALTNDHALGSTE
jgi:hypothetical protein